MLRETVLQALLAALQTMPAATVLRDGDPGTPEVTLLADAQSRCTDCILPFLKGHRVGVTGSLQN